MNEFSNEDLIRSFEEFDEKLPAVAKVIVGRGIDFARLNDGVEAEGSAEFEANYEVFHSISAIFREMVECTSEMTADEFEDCINVLLTACELVVLVNDGIGYEKNGKFFLTLEGQDLSQEIKALDCGEFVD